MTEEILDPWTLSMTVLFMQKSDLVDFFPLLFFLIVDLISTGFSLTLYQSFSPCPEGLKA